MGADLFESYVGSILAAATLGAAEPAKAVELGPSSFQFYFLGTPDRGLPFANHITRRLVYCVMIA